MARTLEKYQRCSYATLEANQPAKDIQVVQSLSLTHALINVTSKEKNSFFVDYTFHIMWMIFLSAYILSCWFVTMLANCFHMSKQSSYQEYLKLKAKAEALQHTQRYHHCLYIYMCVCVLRFLFHANSVKNKRQWEKIDTDN